ncbi:MAG TPA: peptidylprolyl isomerase [Magnetospirillum sp.]|nr:peptidylprolyl isomerase [Magnetospirillum sp.]
MLGTTPSLDYKYTIWGRVTEGMEHVDKITKGSESDNGLVSKPDRIVHMRVAADVKQ